MRSRPTPSVGLGPPLLPETWLVKPPAIKSIPCILSDSVRDGPLRAWMRPARTPVNLVLALEIVTVTKYTGRSTLLAMRRYSDFVRLSGEAVAPARCVLRLSSPKLRASLARGFDERPVFGDEVLFFTDTPVIGAEIGIEITKKWAAKKFPAFVWAWNADPW
jgi:hypothetical protein